MNPDALTLTEIRAALQAQPFKDMYRHFPAALMKGKPRPAAVLIPLVWANPGWEVLFIRRTEVPGDPHSGQVAFPGGRRDRQDPNLTAAALRETREELGVQPEDVEILGQLNEFTAISNYRVTPFVGTLPWPYQIVKERREVAAWFTIPLRWLADPANRRLKHRPLPNGQGEIPVIYFEPYGGELLWGLSARFLVEFLTALGMPL